MCLYPSKAFLKKNLFIVTILFISALGLLIPLDVKGTYTAKIRDLVMIEGIKKNVFTGYGLVVGLAGTGDSQNALTRMSLTRYLKFSGVQVSDERLNTRNVAVVAVSASVKGFAQKGDAVPVQVASIGDARSLENGLLLTTTLRGPDKQVYIVAEGIVHTGTHNNRRATLPAGGIIERSLGTMQSLLNNRRSLTLRLKHASFETMDALRERLQGLTSLSIEAIDNQHIVLRSQNNDPISFKNISDFMNMDITINPKAKVVIDKKTKVIVVGGNLRIGSIVILLDDMSIQIGNPADSSVPSSKNLFPNNTTAHDLAEGLRLLNVTIEEMIAIFEALNQSGAMNAEIIIQ